MAAQVLPGVDFIAEIVVPRLEASLGAIDEQGLEAEWVAAAAGDARTDRDGQCLDTIVGSGRDVDLAVAEGPAWEDEPSPARPWPAVRRGSQVLDALRSPAVAEHRAVSRDHARHLGTLHADDDAADEGQITVDAGTRPQREVAVEHDHVALDDSGQLNRPTQHRHVARDRAPRRDSGSAAEADRRGPVEEVLQGASHSRRQPVPRTGGRADADHHGVLRREGGRDGQAQGGDSEG